MGGVEIHCTACGEDAWVRREPVYDGFKKVGEQIMCSACGHVYEDESDVPYKARKRASVFTDADRTQSADVFVGDAHKRICRYCTHYVVNPFIQRCGIHHREVDATDTCPDFENKPDEPDKEEG